MIIKNYKRILFICFFIWWTITLILCDMAYSAKPPKPPKAKNVSAIDNGTIGQLLVNEGNGNIAQWVNPSTEFKGDTGNQGVQGVKGTQGEQGIKGNIGNQGIKGNKGNRGDKGAKGATGKGLRDRYEVQLETRLIDTKKFALSNYYIYDTNNDNHCVGLKVTLKLGKSYEEKRIEDLEKKLDKLQSLIIGGRKL